MKTFYPKLLILSTFLLFYLSATAQNSRLMGTIYEGENNEPLIGATVKVGETGVVTDYEGKYEIELAPGKHRVEISYLGYEKITKNLVLKSGQSLVFDQTLNVTPNLLQTATVTSGKYEKPLGEVTVSLDILKPRLIEATNATSVSGILGKIPGLSMIGGQANIRGGSGWSYGAGSRVMLLVDDIPALQADAGRPNWSDIPVENTEQIEVVKGAASALYGSAALNGIINVRTAYAKSKPITNISTFYGIYLDPKDKEKIWYDEQPYEMGFTVSHRQKINKFDLVLSSFGSYSKSFREGTWGRRGRVSAGIRYRVNDKLSVGFNSNVNKGKSASYFYWKDWGPDALRGDTSSFSTSKPFRYNIDPFITFYDEKGNRHKYLGRYMGIINDNDGNQSNSSGLYYNEYQFQRQMEDIGLVMTAGLVGIFSGVSAEIYGDTTYTSTNSAAYLQLDQKIGDKLNLSGGMRYERNTLKSPAIVNGDTIPNGKSVEAKPVFRIGANYHLGGLTFLRASWGQGYRFPTIAEKFVATNAGAIRVVPSPKLQSETGWTAELGVKHGIKINEWQGFIDAAIFWSQYQDMMEFTFIPQYLGFQSLNIGNTDIKGLDLSITGEGRLFGLPTYVLAGYTYIDPKFQEFTDEDAMWSSVDYNILKYRFKHTAKFDIETQIQKFSVGIAFNYNSHMEAVDWIFEEFIPGLKEQRREDTDGAKVFDARVTYQFTDKLKMAFIGSNIFNEEYTSRPAQLQAPTQITCRLDYKF